MPALEICCGDIEAVRAALEGGARRIELCSGLTEGGLTPSIGLVRAAVETGMPEINVLIRPRPGDFLYTPVEMNVMESDIVDVIRVGATGVVIGVLDADGEIDTASTGRLVKAARDTATHLGRKINITFHRAFDVAADAGKALEDVISLGCDCLLTSGMAPSAAEGIPVIAALVNQAAGRITVMAGAGVNPDNVDRIVAETRVGAVHSTAREPMGSKMLFRRPEVPMGAPGMDEYAPKCTTPRVVTTLLERINTTL